LDEIRVFHIALGSARLCEMRRLWNVWREIDNTVFGGKLQSTSGTGSAGGNDFKAAVAMWACKDL
jgi:hypothetical protein